MFNINIWFQLYFNKRKWFLIVLEETVFTTRIWRRDWVSQTDRCQSSSSAGSAVWLWCCVSDALERLTCLKLRSRSSVLCLSWLNLDSRCSSTSSSSYRHRWFMRSTCDSSSALHCCLDSHLQRSLLGNTVRTALPLLCVVDDADFLRTRTKRDVRTVNLRWITGALCGRCWSSQCWQNKSPASDISGKPKQWLAHANRLAKQKKINR